MGEAVASGPIRAQWAGSSLWVVHTFFVRAADNPVGHDCRAGSVLLEEGQNLLTNGAILAYLQLAIGEPALEKISVVAFSEKKLTTTLVASLSLGPKKPRWQLGNLENQTGTSCPPRSGRAPSCGMPSFSFSSVQYTPCFAKLSKTG